MGKKLKDLKKGDRIWFVSPYYTSWYGLPSETPKVYEATIDKDSTPQGSLQYPKYCLVYHYCPKLNPNHLNSSECGEKDRGTNGHLFFTDIHECGEYVSDIIIKQLDEAKEKLKHLNGHIEELQEILEKGIKIIR